MLSVMMVLSSAMELAVGGPAGHGITNVFFLAYVGLLVAQLILGLVGGNVIRLKDFYLVASVMSGLIMLLSFVLGAWIATRGVISPLVIAAIALSTGAYFFAALLAGRALEMASVFVQYLVCVPLFVNVFQIYSIAK
jgi:hypothetical protein